MDDADAHGAEQDVLDTFDPGPDRALVCRVCGSLVAATGRYPRAHWDWHEASNGV